jgi:hypothetical protein
MATAARAQARSTRPKVRRRAAASAPETPVPAVLLDATADADVVEVPARTVVAIDGAGPPDAEPFARSLGALYGAAYGLKFARKQAGGGDFKVGALEGRWWAEGAPGDLAAPRETWRWTLRLAVPRDVRATEVAAVLRAATTKKGGKLEGSAEARRVRLERLPRATVGRILHVGPYADEPRSFEKIDAAVAAAGRAPARSHVEIYLSDPRRTAPARLRTVLLRELER